MKAFVLAVFISLVAALATAGPACPAPTPANTSIGFSGSLSQCFAGGTNPCFTNETILFSVVPVGYSLNCEAHIISWSFGDATVGSGASVSHTYAFPGTYTVQMTMQGNTTTTTLSQSINVALPVPALNPQILALLAAAITAVALIRSR